jgi:hypothetical protein
VGTATHRAFPRRAALRKRTYMQLATQAYAPTARSGEHKGAAEAMHNMFGHRGPINRRKALETDIRARGGERCPLSAPAITLYSATPDHLAGMTARTLDTSVLKVNPFGKSTKFSKPASEAMPPTIWRDMAQ